MDKQTGKAAETNKCKTTKHKLITSPSKPSLDVPNGKKEILLLADQLGKGMNSILRRNFKNCTVTSIIKPGASLSAVMANMQNLTKHLSKTDVIIVMAGQNDLLNRSFPSFKIICENLKKCSHTNIIFSSVPYTKSININSSIFKYNCKLNEFIVKLNKVAEGNVKYYEINKETYKINKNTYTNDISDIINKHSFLPKSLIFVPTTTGIQTEDCCSLSIQQDEEPSSVDRSSAEDIVEIIELTTPHTLTTNNAPNLISNEISTNQINDSFLYPRLSQITLAI